MLLCLGFSFLQFKVTHKGFQDIKTFLPLARHTLFQECQQSIFAKMKMHKCVNEPTTKRRQSLIIHSFTQNESDAHKGTPTPAKAMSLL